MAVSAWLAFEARDDECRGCKGAGVVQRQFTGDSRAAIVRDANAVLTVMGVPVERHFDVTVWDYPYSVDLGAGIDAFLYPCDPVSGVNITCGIEPRGE